MQIKFAWGGDNFRQYLWSESLSFRLGLAVAAILIALPLQVGATNVDRSSSNTTTVSNSRQLQAQADSTPLNITGIKLNPRGSSIEVILETAGTIAAPAPQIVGNLLYNEPELEINVVGGLRNSYRVPITSGVTGINTPIIETPFAVQVIPQTIIRDRQSRDIKDAVTNVSGVAYGGDRENRGGNSFSIRGFSDATILNDGFRQLGSAGESGTRATTELANVERIEVLKGPASILYGAILF